MGSLQAKSMTSQRYRAVTRWRMCYYGNVMTTTRWWLCVTMETLWQQQDGGYALLWQRYDNNKMVAMRYYGNVMATTRWRLCVTMFYIFNSTVIDWTCYIFFPWGETDDLPPKRWYQPTGKHNAINRQKTLWLASWSWEAVWLSEMLLTNRKTTQYHSQADH